MNIVIIDGQGGSLGLALVKEALRQFPGASITAVGTNSAASANMLKAGGGIKAAAGENAVIVACRKADIIFGPIGIIVADALVGEVSPTMASAVGASDAVKILIPMEKCATLVAGIEGQTLSALIADAMKKAHELDLK